MRIFIIVTGIYNQESTIILTKRGRIIAGTRITINDVMDYLKANYPPKLIKEKLCLSYEQIETALAYIDLHKTQIEIEYEEYLKEAEKMRKYWQIHNQERLAKISQISPDSQKQFFKEKLQAWKQKIESYK